MDGVVLLGDLIASRKSAPAALDHAMQTLRQTTDALGVLAGEAHFTRFRGDGWQLVTLRPEMALRIALTMMARLTGEGELTTRVAIGFGQIDDLAGGDLGAASGNAFLRSGQALDEMSGRRHLVMIGAPAEATHWLDAQLHLLEFIADRWSPQQAEIVAMALTPGWGIQADLAERLGISRQAVQSRLKGAGYPAIATALRAFETFDWTRNTHG